MIVQILWGILFLSFLIIIHEFGHFIAAKACGVKVLEFSLFMGPKLFSKTIGETTYSLRLIPMGGYVKMEGEEEESDDERAFSNKSVWQRIVIILAGPLTNIVAAIIAFIILVSVQGTVTTQISDIDQNSSLYKAGVQVGDKIEKINGRSVFTTNEYSLFTMPLKENEDVSVVVKRGDEHLTYNLKATKKEDTTKYVIGFYTQKNNLYVDQLISGYPSEEAGLEVGDVITAVNGEKVDTKIEFDKIILENQENDVVLTVLRGGKEIDLNKINPVKEEQKGYVTIGDVAFSSVSPKGMEALKYALTESYSTARVVTFSLGYLVTGKVSPAEMSGPVGIVTAIGGAVESTNEGLMKLITLLYFIGLISMNLGIFNLIPFPALDGSKVLLYAIEGIRRKPISKEKEAYITLVGFVVLVILLIYTTWNDIARLIGG